MATKTKKKKTCKEPARAIKFSEILHRASDHYLYSGVAAEHRKRHQSFSCFAVESAIESLLKCQDISEGKRNTRYRTLEHKTFNGLERMGHYDADFESISDKQERQAVRYMWLKLAALLAEDQGR